MLSGWYFLSDNAAKPYFGKCLDMTAQGAKLCNQILQFTLSLGRCMTTINKPLLISIHKKKSGNPPPPFSITQYHQKWK
jgi:hypothetical protein